MRQRSGIGPDRTVKSSRSSSSATPSHPYYHIPAKLQNGSIANIPSHETQAPQPSVIPTGTSSIGDISADMMPVASDSKQDDTSDDEDGDQAVDTTVPRRRAAATRAMESVKESFRVTRVEGVLGEPVVADTGNKQRLPEGTIFAEASELAKDEIQRYQQLLDNGPCRTDRFRACANILNANPQTWEGDNRCPTCLSHGNDHLPQNAYYTGLPCVVSATALSGKCIKCAIHGFQCQAGVVWKGVTLLTYPAESSDGTSSRGSSVPLAMIEGSATKGRGKSRHQSATPSARKSRSVTPSHTIESGSDVGGPVIEELKQTILEQRVRIAQLEANQGKSELASAKIWREAKQLGSKWLERDVALLALAKDLHAQLRGVDAVNKAPSVGNGDSGVAILKDFFTIKSVDNFLQSYPHLRNMAESGLTSLEPDPARENSTRHTPGQASNGDGAWEAYEATLPPRPDFNEGGRI